MAADRRFAYAVDYAARGEIKAAIDLLEQCRALVPQWPPAPFHQGLYHQEDGNRDAAIEAYTEYLRLDPRDYMGAALKLSLLGAMEALRQFGEGYVQALFDQYAPRFDEALVAQLHYNVPQRLFDMVSNIRPAADKSERILDLGCGTGLAGERFARRAAVMDGVDLSPGMIAQAAAKQLYTRLETADIGGFLPGVPAGSYDLVLAADVFVYVGALDGIMPKIAAALAPGGLCAFSVQSDDGHDFRLGADHRFAHSLPYLRRMANAAGLVLRETAADTLRRDRGHDIAGYLVLMEKPAPALGTGLAMLQDMDTDAALYLQAASVKAH